MVEKFKMHIVEHGTSFAAMRNGVASGIEARRAETRSGSVYESPAPVGETLYQT